MTRDWKLTVTMKDYDSGDEDKAFAIGVLEETLQRGFGVSFSHDGKGCLTSKTFERKIQNDLTEYWEGFFPKKYGFEVVAEEQETGNIEPEEICWTIKGGVCVSCLNDGDELVKDAPLGAEDDYDGDEFNVNGSYRSVQFYAKEGAKPNTDGVYEDFIGVVEDDFIVADWDGENLYSVYINLDEDEDEEEERIVNKYVEPYINNGIPISAKQTVIPKDDIVHVVGSIIVLTEDTPEDEDEANGVRLYRL